MGFRSVRFGCNSSSLTSCVGWGSGLFDLGASGSMIFQILSSINIHSSHEISCCVWLDSGEIWVDYFRISARVMIGHSVGVFSSRVRFARSNIHQGSHKRNSKVDFRSLFGSGYASNKQ